MVTSFPVASSSNIPVHQESCGDSGKIHPSTTGSSLALVLAKPMALKQDSGATSSAKRVPQRGLGVAQLERIRLQEHFDRLSSRTDGGRKLINPQQHPLQIRPVPSPPPAPAHYNNPQYTQVPVSRRFSFPNYSVPATGGRSDPPPSPAAPITAMDPNWPLQRYIPQAKLAAGYDGAAPREIVHSNMVRELHTVDFFRTNAGVSSGDARHLHSIDVPFQGAPSTQTTQGHPPFYDFFERKSHFGDGPKENTTHFIDFFKENTAAASDTSVHQESLGVDGMYENKRMPMKELDFFPVRSNSSITPAAAASEPTFLDLSLKL